MEQQNTGDKFFSRDKEVRATISEEEAIHLIENVYHAQYDPHCGLDGCFDAWNQLLACESVAESTPIERYLNKEDEENVSVSGIDIDIGGSKRQENDTQSINKNEAILRLQKSNYRTPSKEIALNLEMLFGFSSEYPNHWLYIASHYTPKSINSVLREVDKCAPTCPASFFTKLLKRYHPKRRIRKRKIYWQDDKSKAL